MSRTKEQDQKIQEVISGEGKTEDKLDQVAEIRGWFGPKENSTNYAIIKEHLQQNNDVEGTASRLFALIDEMILAQKLDGVDDCFWDLWMCIIHNAKCTSFEDIKSISVAKTVDLVVAIKNHTVPGNEQHNHIYSDMRDFGMACREVMNDTPGPTACELEINAWMNVNLFFAQITDRGLLDLWIFALWSMREALERNYQDDEEGTAIQKYNVLVPAAAAWVFGMGKSLANKEEDLTPKKSNQGDPASGGELWEGKSEFSKARWSFWKERFAVIAKMEGVSRKTSDIAKDAVEAMERSETFENVHQSDS